MKIDLLKNNFINHLCPNFRIEHAYDFRTRHIEFFTEWCAGQFDKKFFITDTISADRELGSKIEVVSVGDTFGDAIERIESGESLSALFDTE